MQALKRIVRDVLVVTAVGATASVQADSLLDDISFEELAGATLDEFMPWGLFGGDVVGDTPAGPLSGLPQAPSQQPEPQLELLSDIGLPDPTSCALLLGGLLGWAGWQRRVQRRRHAGAIGAYMV